jgi:uncharacterized protein YndB with AHSA1/START domain
VRGNEAASEDAVRHGVTVPASPEEAFAAFTERMAEWWPRAYTWAEDAIDAVVVEPRAGGRWYERDAAGAEQAWGSVRAWDAPRRIVLAWRVSPTRTQEPPERASEVEARFVPADGDTRVELEHRHFAAHGAQAADGYRDAMASPQGWPLILDRFAGLFA